MATQNGNEIAQDLLQSHIFKIGIIGGTGLEDPQIMERIGELRTETPYGTPSDALIEGNVAGIPCVLLSSNFMHGRRHHLSPTNINYRANIWALKQAGVSVIIAACACGSLKEELAPGKVVIVDSFIDRTTKREQTFYDGLPHHLPGICHLPMHPAFSEPLRQALITTAQRLAVPHSDRGVLVCVEGPRFSTRAESELFRQWGAELVGMTMCPEAVLSKELGIPYASIAVVTDYDCWRDTAKGVNISLVAETMRMNAQTMQRLLVEVIKTVAERKEEFIVEAQNTKALVLSSVMAGEVKPNLDHLNFSSIPPGQPGTSGQSGAPGPEVLENGIPPGQPGQPGPPGQIKKRHGSKRTRGERVRRRRLTLEILGGEL